MAKYRYAGPGPAEDDDGFVVRPGDVREFDAEPSWGPWDVIPDDEDQADEEKPPAAASTPPAAVATPPPAAPPVRPPTASVATPGTSDKEA